MIETLQAPRVDATHDPAAWLARAEAECRDAWLRGGRRYARRLREQHLARDAVHDVLALAARSVVPQERSVRRPLLVGGVPRVARAFNALETADRAVLSWTRRASRGGPRAEHAASALARLVARAARRRRRALRRAS